MTEHTPITASVGDVSLRLRFHSQADKGWLYYVIDSRCGTLRFPSRAAVARLAKKYGRVSSRAGVSERRLGEMYGLVLPSGMPKAARAAFLGAIASVCKRAVLPLKGSPELKVLDYFSVDRFQAIGIPHSVAVRAHGIVGALAQDAVEEREGNPIETAAAFLAFYSERKRIRRTGMGKKTIYAINALLCAGNLAQLDLQP